MWLIKQHSGHERVTNDTWAVANASINGSAGKCGQWVERAESMLDGRWA